MQWKKMCAAMVFAAGMVSTGCGGGGNNPPPSQIKVTVSPLRAALTTGQTLNYSATVTGTSTTTVTWEVDGVSGGNASTGTIDASGKYTAPTAGGAHTVTARSSADTTKSGNGSVGITDLAGVFTYHNDNSRSGVNSKEYALTPATVKTGSFVKIFSCMVTGAIYAQPLWVPNVMVNGAKHNVVLVVTMRNWVYLFDAEANPCSTLWSMNLNPTGEIYVSYTDVGTPQSSNDVRPDIGILGTPVIDSATNTIYLVTNTKTTGGSPVVRQRLHALNLLDGTERANSPVNLTTAITVAGNGQNDPACPSGSGTIAFCPLRQGQRAGLALGPNGNVYVAWASHNIVPVYHGWVMSFDKTSLAITGKYNTSPNGQQSGIWMAGGAPGIDSSGNVFVMTGNGFYDGATEFGDSALKLNGSNLALLDSFTPSNESQLNATDKDLGSGGVTLLIDLPNAPVKHVLIGGGKGANFDGGLYVLNRDNLGGKTATDSGAVQALVPTNGGAIFSTPAFWNNTLYLTPVGKPLAAYPLDTTTGLLSLSTSSQTTSSFGFPGATPSVSSNGTSSGIVWVIDSHSYGTNSTPTAAGPAVLHAFDASDLTKELWNSQMVSTDNAAFAVKFTVPTVANGRVYMGTRGNDDTVGTPTVTGQLEVYGLKPN